MRQSKTRYLPKNTADLSHLPKIRGHDFNEPFSFKAFINAYATTGMQASHLSEAIHIVKAMLREKADIFLSCTSNMMTSGVRESVRYLVQHKKVSALILTAGGVEEDLIKCLKPFALGSFRADGKFLFGEGVNRTGNILVPDDRYAAFEQWLTPLLKQLTEERGKQEKKGKGKGSARSGAEFLAFLGKSIGSEESVLYWAWKNSIPVFCPAITDGSLGDLLYFHRQRDPSFQLDTLADMQKIVSLSLNAEKTGVICLGGGVAKHFCLNAQIFREGAEYAVYLNSASEHDGSDSGASTDEAVSWGKIRGSAPQVKVQGDATILFPLLLAAVLEA